MNRSVRALRDVIDCMTTDVIEQNLRRRFEAELPGRIERYAMSPIHGIIPDGYISAASTECREHFIAGQFYGCITLAQSVAEGLAKFIAEKNGLDVVEDHGRQINILQRDRVAPSISNEAYAAFRTIVGRPREDRNDFHHLNSSVEQDYRALEARALECVESLYAIESEVFAFSYGDGGILNPVHPKYWPRDGSDLNVYLRLG